MRNIVRLAMVTVALGTAQHCRADFEVSLSSPDNLANLTVGQVITINVTLSGVSSTNVLDELGITVSDPPILFNAPTMSFAGSIVPDLTGLLTAPAPGVADATYDDILAMSGTPITTNGIFFSAQFTAVAPGSGTFQFTDISGFQGSNLVTVDNGTLDGLAYTIAAQVTTPAPASVLLAGLGSVVLAACHALRMRCRC